MSATSTAMPSFSLRVRTVSPVHIGRNSGYFSTSATRSNILSGACGTCRVVSNLGMMRGSGRLLRRKLARGLQPGEILPGVVGGARQRARRNEQEPLRVGDRLVGFELLRSDELFDRVVLLCGLQILPDRQEIDIGRPEIVHQLQHL